MNSSPQVVLSTRVHPQSILQSNDEEVVSVQLKIHAPGAEQGVPPRPLNLGLIFDTSGSMRAATDSSGSSSKIDAARQAAGRIVQRCRNDDIFSLIAFSDQAEVITPATRLGGLRDEVYSSLKKLKAYGPTNLETGMTECLRQMGKSGGEDYVTAVFVLTDGKVHDAAACLALTPQYRGGVEHFCAGGLGSDYEHKFLEQLCGGQQYVDHIESADGMNERLNSFFGNKANLVTSNCMLEVRHPQVCKVLSIQREPQTRNYLLDQNRRVRIPDLFAGKEQNYLVKFLVTPSAMGSMQLAQFVLHYDLPGAKRRGQQSSGDLVLKITVDRSEAGIPDEEVLKIARNIRTTRLAERAQNEIEAGDRSNGTRLLQQVAHEYEEMGDMQRARKTTQLIEELGDDVDDDLASKRARGTTKVISE